MAGGRRFKSSLPDQLLLDQSLAVCGIWDEPLAQYPGGQIRAPFVLIFLKTYVLS